MHCTQTTTQKQVINRTSDDNDELGASTDAPNSFFISLIAFQPIREGVFIFREGEIFFCEGENKLCEGEITAYYMDGIRYEWMYLPKFAKLAYTPATGS